MKSFISHENNCLNFKHGTFNQTKNDLAIKIEYLNTLWKYFEWEKVNLNRWLSDNIKNETTEEEKNYYKELEFRTYRLFPHNFLSTNLTQLYTIFETKLGSICNFYQNHYDIKLSEAEKNEIKRTKDNFLWLKYLLKQKDINISKFDPQFNEIKQFQKLRNSIAHQGDRIALSKPDDNGFRSFLNRMDGIIVENQFWVQEGGLDYYLMVSDYPNKRFYNLCLEFFAILLDIFYPTTKDNLWETINNK